MRYPAGHKAQKRQQLLQASGALIKESGFAATGVDAIAQAAGVTSGAFYSHFASKSDLLGALVERELQHSTELWAGKLDQSLAQWLDYVMDHYLSLAHVQSAGAGCVLPALGAEVARADKPVKEVFARELQRGIDALALRLGSEQVATAVISQMVGALLLARAMPTQQAQQAVLDANKATLKVMLLAAPESAGVGAAR